MSIKPRSRLFPLFFLGCFVTGVSAQVEAPFEVGTWANFCQGAVSHTFDDNTAGQTGIAQPMFDEKGFHMTLFTVTGSMNPNWTNMKNAFAKGHEIASHSVTHAQTMPDAECPTSQQTIREMVPGEMCVTIAYPNCNIPTSQTLLKQCYIAGRVCDGQIVNKSPSDFYRIGAIMAGSAGTNTTSGFNSKADEAAAKNGWLVWCHHGVGNDGHGYSNTNIEALRGNIDYLDKNRGKLWVESFSNVIRYIKERDAVKISLTSSSTNSITLQVTDNLVDSIYNYPLSICRELPSGWTTAYVRQGGKAVEDTIVTVTTAKYVMFKAVPDAGDVIISKDASSAITGVPTFTNNAQVRFSRQRTTLTIEPGRFSCAGAILTLYDLCGKTRARYPLGDTESRIVIPTDKLPCSALLVEIAGGGARYSGTLLPQL